MLRRCPCRLHGRADLYSRVRPISATNREAPFAAKKERQAVVAGHRTNRRRRSAIAPGLSAAMDAVIATSRGQGSHASVHLSG